MANDTQAEGKKLEIVKHAFERFYEGGFHATGVDTVMADSGISKRTLYKYFPSKEELIEAVLDYYAKWIMHELFDPVMVASNDPREQIIAFFDIRRAMIDECPTRGCLGLKASMEYIGKHEGIANVGKTAASLVEQRFIAMCTQAGFAEPAKLGKQLNIIFQGALLLSQVSGDSSPFVSAKEAVLNLMNTAPVADPHRKGSQAKANA